MLNGGKLESKRKDCFGMLFCWMPLPPYILTNTYVREYPGIHEWTRIARVLHGSAWYCINVDIV